MHGDRGGGLGGGLGDGANGDADADSGKCDGADGGKGGRGGGRGAKVSGGDAARRRAANLSKTCPACGQLNSLGQLSCVLCAAKFSVKHTAELLQQRVSREEPSKSAGSRRDEIATRS